MNSNTKKINRQIAITLACCSLVVVGLLLLKYYGFFEFSGTLAVAIPLVGFSTTLTPIILYLLKVNDVFLKYYMSLAMAVFVGLLGCFNGIGIYISFVIVPIASCLYFDRTYTIICSIFSYFVMAGAVYVNSAGKYEIKFMGWTHTYTFFAYMIGFTMEYIAVSLFVAQIVKRARTLMMEQHQADLAQKAQDARYQLLVKETKDIIFEIYPKEGRLVANRSIIKGITTDDEYICFDNLYENMHKYPGLQDLYNHVTANIFDSTQSDEFEADLSYEENGEVVPLWFHVECFVVKDGDDTVSVIGKMHDITNNKLLQNDIRRNSLERIYSDSKKRNTLYEQIVADSENFTESDFNTLTTGHTFISGIGEELIYSEDLRDGINKALGKIGEYFKADGICAIETDMSSGSNELAFHWNLKNEKAVRDYIASLNYDDLYTIKRIFSEKGYAEINFLVPEEEKDKYNNILYKEKDRDAILGNQIWIPIVTNGRYYGTFCIDRYDPAPYTVVEKFLFAEAVNLISSHISKLNAENANKAKSDFLSTMSHEIRTPMNAIVGMTEVALREDMPESVKNSLSMVKSSAFGLLTLINDILDYSKIEAGRFEIVPERFSLLSILNDVKVITLARNAGKLDVEFLVPEDLPMEVYGDSVRIKQVMINYCTNAIKYSDKGKVLVKIGFSKTDDKSGRLRFAVKDNGIGIKKEDLSKLFKSYTRVDTTLNHHKEGTGLGLAISKQLVELMEGYVNVESEYGKGSTFSFDIPLGVEKWEKAGRLEDFKYEDVQTKEEPVVVAPNAKVLIVDDNKVNLVVSKALLKPTKIMIDTAESGEDALRMVEANDYDLVFMDHFMPGMDGVETTKRIRMLESDKKNVPIIALTADAMSGVREELLSKGMNDFLTKPLIVDELYRVLREWLPET